MLPSAVASVEVPLNQAVVQFLQNTVELSPQDQAPHPAKVKDTLSPGEALSTARASLAELRFNDGSLARVGGQARIRFVSQTRTLQLSNGTMLLLVPPDRGQTRIQTPNAVASVRGSALFVRYVPETDITLVGALTSNVEIANGDRSQTQMLGAGQLAVVTNNRLEPAYGFDLKTFYETSTLARGLNLQPLLAGERSGSADGAIEAVRAETTEALQRQTPLCTVNGVPPETTPTAKPALRQPKPANGVSCRPTSAPSSAPANEPADGSLTQPTSSDRPAQALLTAPTVALPATIPPTLALPTNIPLTPSTAIAPSSPVAPSLPERPPFLNPNSPNPNPLKPDFLNPNPPSPSPASPNLPSPILAAPTVNNSVTPGP